MGGLFQQCRGRFSGHVGKIFWAHGEGLLAAWGRSSSHVVEIFWPCGEDFLAMWGRSSGHVREIYSGHVGGDLSGHVGEISVHMGQICCLLVQTRTLILLLIAVCRVVGLEHCAQQCTAQLCHASRESSHATTSVTAQDCPTRVGK